MADPFTILAIISAVSAGAGIQQGRQAAKEQEKASKKQERISQIQNARQRRRALAESIAQRARVEAVAESQGAAESSSAQGAVGALQTQTAANISFQKQLEGLDQSRLRSLRRATSFSSNASTLGSLGNLAATAGGFDSSGQAIGSFFNGK